MFVQVRGYDGAVGATGAGASEGLVVSEWSVARGGTDDAACRAKADEGAMALGMAVCRERCVPERVVGGKQVEPHVLRVGAPRSSTIVDVCVLLWAPGRS